MKELNVEWRHFEASGKTCQRCADTGENLKKMIDSLNSGMEGRRIKVTLTETKLPAESMEQSNMLLFNGIPLEDLLNQVEASANYCSSCSCLTGERTDCRTIVYKGKTYEDVPAEVLRLAAVKALESQESK